MTTSGSYNYNTPAGIIITEALEIIGALAAGETLSAEDYFTGLRSLNLMVKAWQNESIGLWKNVEGALFLQYNDGSYSIGPSGDNSTASWIKTEIATAAAAGAGTITVDSDDGISSADYIGVELNGGTVQWTTVNGAPVANVITLTAVLTDAAAIDNHVYTYTSKIQRPLELIEVRLYSNDDTDRPLEIVSRQEYMRISDKTNLGSPNIVYYDPQRTNWNFYTWPRCNDVKEYIKFTARIPIEDFDTIANDPDFPQEWLLALSWNLASIIAPKFGKTMAQIDELKAAKFKADVSGFDREQASVFIEPNMDNYI